MQIIPAIDILDGRIVRLKQGNYLKRTDFGDDLVAVAKKFEKQGASNLNLINLTGSENGCFNNDFLNIVYKISKSVSLKIQAGGGIRTLKDIDLLLKNGAGKVIIGTMVVTDPNTAARAVKRFGPGRIIAAADTAGNSVRISGWKKDSKKPLSDVIRRIIDLGISTAMVTAINRDGMENGPDAGIYKSLKKQFPGLNLIAAGGVRNAGDIRALKPFCDGAVVGRSLLNGKIDYTDLLKGNSDLAIRIIPCLDIKNGRVVKGTKFKDLKDSGDPVELAKKYCNQGADELTFLDISATNEKRSVLFSLAEKVAREINIPFTVGGGIKSVIDAKNLLMAGADKVSVNSAAVKNPRLLSEISNCLGSANTVCALDAKKQGDKWIVLTNGGSRITNIDAVDWAEEAVKRGAGELLVTSFDRDGTEKGYDNELLSRIKELVNVPVIASGGAGNLADFAKAATTGKADALLAAGVFHKNIFSVKDVKKYLFKNNLPVRL